MRIRNMLVSKNRPTIEHLSIACRHVQELMAVGVTENLAIRTLELFTDVYAKLVNGGSATPHHVKQVPLNQWSIAARQLLMAKDRGGLCLDNFEWWSLAPDWSVVDQQVLRLAPPHIDGPSLVPDLWQRR